MTGLSAAQVLTRHGYSVVVFDKARRPGGRLASRRDEQWAFDHGAQYFTAKHPQFQRAVRQWLADGVVARWPGRIGTFNGDGLVPAGEGHKRYVGVPEMNALAAYLGAGQDIRTLARITELRREASATPPRSRHGWTLTDETGLNHEGFDAVIVALPADQARPLLEAARDAEARLDMPTLDMSPCWCVMLGLDHPAEIPFDGVFVNDGPISWMARNNSKPGRLPGEAWVIHAGPEWSAEHLEDDPTKVSQALVRAAERVLGQPLTPAHTRAHRWRYALGSVATPGATWDSGSRLGVAGDWLGGGRVEGAWLSGLKVAEELVNDLER